MTYIHAVSEDAEILELLQPHWHGADVDQEPTKDHHEGPHEGSEDRANRVHA